MGYNVSLPISTNIPSIEPLFCLLTHNKLPNLPVRLIQVVVDDDLVVDAASLGKLHLHAGLLEALLDRVLGVGRATTQPLLKDLEAGRREEEEARARKSGVRCYLLDALFRDVSTLGGCALALFQLPGGERRLNKQQWQDHGRQR